MSHTISWLVKCLSTFTTNFSCLRIPKFCLSQRGKQNLFSWIFPWTVDRTVGIRRHLLPTQAPKLSVDNSVTPHGTKLVVFGRRTEDLITSEHLDCGWRTWQMRYTSLTPFVSKLPPSDLRSKPQELTSFAAVLSGLSLQYCVGQETPRSSSS